MRKSTPNAAAAAVAKQKLDSTSQAERASADADGDAEPEIVDGEGPEAALGDALAAGDLDLDSPEADLGLAGIGDEEIDAEGEGGGTGRRAGRPRRASEIVEVGDGKASTSLARSDPLTVYMAEIRRYPLLTREEEHELAVRFAETQDPKIARRLITANLRLVVKIAHEYRRAYRNLLDLVQEGNLGLLQAVQKYDPHRGVKLSSYSAWWIRAYMLKFILNNWRLVKIGTTQAQRKLFFNLTKEREKLEAAGFVPTTKLLAERLSVPEQEVAEMQLRLAASDASLDAPIGSGDDESGKRTHLDMLESANSSRPDVTAESDEFRALLRQKLETFEATLKGREQTLFHDRLMADQPLTLQEVGERYGISRERARQIEARLLSRLKQYLKKELGDAVQVAMGLD
jgi:RNA polymerase sigma-32 factor